MSYFNTNGPTRRQQAVYDLVKTRPRTTDELIALVYAEHPVATARKAIHVFVCQLNKKLKDERIKSSREDFRYRLTNVV